MILTADEVDLSLVRKAKIFHFGSLSMTDKICENATKHAIAAAKEAGVLISCQNIMYIILQITGPIICPVIICMLY